MISDRDIVTRAVAEGFDPDECYVREIMSRDVMYCYEDETTDVLARNMAGLQIKRLPVLSRDKRLVGIVSLGDLALVRPAKNRRNGPCGDFSQPAARRWKARCRPPCSERSGRPRPSGEGRTAQGVTAADPFSRAHVGRKIGLMSKAFVKDNDNADDDDLPEEPGLPAGVKNYMTPAGRRGCARSCSTCARRAAEGGGDGLLGGGQRRPLGERRLHLRQEAPARDRPAHPLPDQAAGDRRDRRPGAAEEPRAGVLRRHASPMPATAAPSARCASSASTRPIWRAAR